MTLWENLKKHLTALIDIPIEAAHGKAYLNSSGTLAASLPLTYVRPPVKRSVLRETGSKNIGSRIEKIYPYEAIDPKTIRVFKEVQTAPNETSYFSKEHKNFDDELDFGSSWRRWIIPCQLTEPLYVLGLSTQAEQALISRGWKTLGDLLRIPSSSKSIGLGHIEELNHKLQKYLENKKLSKSSEISWGAWLRSLMIDFHPKDAKLLLHHFGLGEVITLPRHHSTEMRRYKNCESADQINELLTQIKKSDLSMVLERWKIIVSSLITPWVRQRSGIVHLEELMERFEIISEQPHLTSRAFAFLEYLFEKQLFATVFSPVSQEIYAVDEESARVYAMIKKIASSYFYKPSLSYSLSELSYWIMRETVRRWEQCDEIMIEKVLKVDPSFCVYTSTSGPQIALRGVSVKS